jgi:hypothetical protein
MTAERLRMTAERLRMTGRRLRMTGERSRWPTASAVGLICDGSIDPTSKEVGHRSGPDTTKKTFDRNGGRYG